MSRFMWYMVVVLTVNSRQHRASHGQHQSQRAAQQEAVRHLKVEPAWIQHQTGAAATAHLCTLLHQTERGRTKINK